MTITVNYEQNSDNVNVFTKYNRYVEAWDWYTMTHVVVPEAEAVKLANGEYNLA